MAYSKNRRLADIIADTSGNLSVQGITVPTQSNSDNDTSAASTAFVHAHVNALIDSAPGTLNTLNEIAAALNDDPTFTTTVNNAIATKLPLAGGTMTGDISHASNFTVSAGGNITLDSAGDIILDADGDDWKFHEGGTAVFEIKHESHGVDFLLNTGNEDWRFKGSDDGTTITALHLDISEGGAATFNAGGSFGGAVQLNDAQLNIHSSSASAIIGSIGNTANDLNIFSTTTGHNGLRFHVNGILPTDNSGTIIDNDADLGDPSYRFKDLYLGGNVTADSLAFEAVSGNYTTIVTAAGYSSQGYSSSQRYWNHMISRGGTHITLNSDASITAVENTYDDFVVWQHTQDGGEPLFRVSNTGRVIAKQNYEIGDHKTNKEEFGVNAINTIDTATSNINTTVTNTYENRSGVYWLNFNSKKFRAFIRPQWLQGRNWVLAAKFFAFNDMPSGSALWTNDASWNGGDFDLNNGHFSKYGKVWRYFGFNRLAMQMGDIVAPIMQFSSTQTLYGAFSGGYAANGGGVTASSTDPQIGNSATYHGMTNYMGPGFTDLGGSEDIMQSYGLNKWAAANTNSTSANNQSSFNKTGVVKGHQLTVEDSHPNISGNDSLGRAGAWIGCPLDEGGYTFGGASSNAGADSGFGFGGGCGNPARTWTSGVGEWARGNEVANYLPAYIWLSID